MYPNSRENGIKGGTISLSQTFSEVHPPWEVMSFSRLFRKKCRLIRWLFLVGALEKSPDYRNDYFFVRRSSHFEPTHYLVFSFVAGFTGEDQIL